MVVGMIIATGASLTASVFVVQVAVLPLLFRYSKSVQRKIVFSNCFNYPRNLDYENPSNSDIIGGRNFNIEFYSKADNCNIKLGVWHMIPCKMFREVFVIRDYKNLDSRLHNELKQTRNPIVLYCHGNSNHRASPHRLQMYKVFQELNFHVIAFDYRGYGDSTPIRPTEAGVVEDALEVYSWLVENLKSDPKPVIILWGHSLGTAVISNLVAHMDDLCRKNDKPTGLPRPTALVLEAPFNNLVEEIECHPFSKLVSWLPYYHDSFVKPFSGSPEFTFATDEYLSKVPDMPILILHSECDRIVPHELAVKLFKTVNASRGPKAAPIVLHTFHKKDKLGHNNICEAKDLKTVIGKFIERLHLDPPLKLDKRPSVFFTKTNLSIRSSKHNIIEEQDNKTTKQTRAKNRTDSANERTDSAKNRTDGAKKHVDHVKIVGHIKEDTESKQVAGDIKELKENRKKGKDSAKSHTANSKKNKVDATVHTDKDIVPTDDKKPCPTDKDAKLLRVMRSCYPLYAGDRAPKRKLKNEAKIIVAIRNYDLSSEHLLESLCLDIPITTESFPSIHVGFAKKMLGKKKRHVQTQKQIAVA